MPPKMDLTPTSGHASPTVPARSATPPNITTPTVTTSRAQQSPSDPRMPGARTPPRSGSAASTSQQPRSRSPLRTGEESPKTEATTSEATAATKAPELAATTPTASTANAADVRGASDKSRGKIVAAEVTEADVAEARAEFLQELDQLGMDLVKAGGDPAQLSAAQHPTEQSLTEALRTLTEGGGDPETLGPEHKEAIAVMDAYVKGETAPKTAATSSAPGATPTPGALAAQVLQDAGNAPLSDRPAPTGTSAADKFMRAGRVLHAALQRVNANEDFGSKGTVAASVGNVAMRNFLAVWIPTLMRQYVSYGLEAGMEKVGLSDAGRAAIGALAPAGAVISLGAGAVRDRMNGTHTLTSEVSRAIMATAITGAAVATVATGAMPAAAPLTAAFALYCIKRDVVVQSRLRLTNADNPVPDKKHWSAISLLYGADQGLVSAGMSLLASPSGAAAHIAKAGVQSGNALVRATLNWLGENAEDLMFQGIPSLRSYLDKNQESKPLRLSIKDVGYQSTHVKNAILAPLAVRTGILACTLGTGAIIGRYLGGEKSVEIATDVMVAGYNAWLYHSFANSGSGQAQVTDAAHDAEQGHDEPAQAGTELTVSRRTAQPATSA